MPMCSLVGGLALGEKTMSASPEVISAVAAGFGGFLAGFGSAAAVVKVLIDRALAEFKEKLGKGDDGFITRREAHLAFQERK